jgi:hypothetical protein
MLYVNMEKYYLQLFQKCQQRCFVLLVLEQPAFSMSFNHILKELFRKIFDKVWVHVEFYEERTRKAWKWKYEYLHSFMPVQWASPWQFYSREDAARPLYIDFCTLLTERQRRGGKTKESGKESSIHGQPSPRLGDKIMLFISPLTWP